MATTYIRPTTTTVHGGRLLNIVDQINNSIADLRVLYSSMLAMRGGTDYTRIETMFGLNAGEGQTVFNYVKESIELIDALDGTQPNKLQKLLQRLG